VTAISLWRAASPASGKAESPRRRLHRFQLLNDRPKSKNVTLLQFQTDNVALRRASDAYRSHVAEGNRSRGAMGGLMGSVSHNESSPLA
jgi:hypothetical protein